MTPRCARFAFEATKRLVGLLLLLSLFVSQPLLHAEAAPDIEAHGQHQAHAAHNADCPMTSPGPAAAAHGDPCQDHAAMAHCSVAPCCFHNSDGLPRAEFHPVLTSQGHRFDKYGAVCSRVSSPQDRPPRLV